MNKIEEKTIESFLKENELAFLDKVTYPVILSFDATKYSRNKEEVEDLISVLNNLLKCYKRTFKIGNTFEEINDKILSLASESSSQESILKELKIRYLEASGASLQVNNVKTNKSKATEILFQITEFPEELGDLTKAIYDSVYPLTDMGNRIIKNVSISSLYDESKKKFVYSEEVDRMIYRRSYEEAKDENYLLHYIVCNKLAFYLNVVINSTGALPSNDIRAFKDALKKFVVLEEKGGKITNVRSMHDKDPNEKDIRISRIRDSEPIPVN